MTIAMTDTLIPNELDQHLATHAPDDIISTVDYVERGGRLVTRQALIGLRRLRPALRDKIARLEPNRSQVQGRAGVPGTRQAHRDHRSAGDLRDQTSAAGFAVGAAPGGATEAEHEERVGGVAPEREPPRRKASSWISPKISHL